MEQLMDVARLFEGGPLVLAADVELAKQDSDLTVSYVRRQYSGGYRAPNRIAWEILPSLR